MPKLEVFDPPMCCATGVCGPGVDPKLTRVAADLDWLGKQGVSVSRHNLSQEPGAFATNATVSTALKERGNNCLPLVLLDGRVIAEGDYPSREQLEKLLGLSIKANPNATVECKPTPDGKKCC